jgi:hypothetical protein
MSRESGDPTSPLRKEEEPRKPRNTKRAGEISEAAFLHKAVGLGFKVTKPWGDSERYDFVLDSGRRFWRVQIKCTAAMHAGGYHIQPIHFVYGERKVVYTDAEIDVLAAHIVPLDVWYVVPVQAIAAGTSLRLYPDGGCERARFEKYREAWDLFRSGESVSVPPDPLVDPSVASAFSPDLAESDRATAEEDQGAGEEQGAQWGVRQPIWKPRVFGIR